MHGRFEDALRSAVELCFGTVSAHLHATFIAQAAAQQQQQQQLLEQQQAAAAALAAAAAAAAASPPASPSPAASASAPPLPDPVAPFQTTATPASPGPSTLPSAPSPVSPFVCAAASPTPRHSVSGAGGDAPQWSPGSPLMAPGSRASSGAIGARRTVSSPLESLAAAAVVAQQPRPLARCLRAVQGACEPLFADTREVTLSISNLPRVMSLCACAFAAPPLHI